MTIIQAIEIVADPFVRILSEVELASGEPEYYFGSLLPKSVRGIVFKSLKDRDVDNYEFFYRKLKDWAKKNSFNMYFLRVGFHVSKKSALRTKMSLRKEIAIAHRSDLFKFEVEGHNGTSRLAVIGPLIEEPDLMPLKALLGWGNTIVIITELEVEQIAQRAKAWVNTGKASILGFNFSCIHNDLERDPATIVCRFFPDDNGRPAALSMVFGRK